MYVFVPLLSVENWSVRVSCTLFHSTRGTHVCTLRTVLELPLTLEIDVRQIKIFTVFTGRGFSTHFKAILYKVTNVFLKV